MKFEDYSRTFLHFHTTDVPAILQRHLSGTQGLVDLGAGDGSLLVSLKMAGMLDSFAKVVAVDLSEQRCERLRQYTNFSVICGDATNATELASESFDFVLCTQVIEHVDEQALLHEIMRVLKPGGKAYIASVVKKKYGWWYNRNAEGTWVLDPTHLREYESVEQYESVIRTGGLEIIETITSQLTLSIIEFILRRIVVPIFNPTDIHSFFIRYPFFDWLRRHFNVHPPGYQIIETVARKA